MRASTIAFPFVVWAKLTGAQIIDDQSALFAVQQAPIGPLGFVTGLVLRPVTPFEKYVRTDVGGAYTWLPGSQSWRPMTDGLDMASQIGGVVSLAIDPAAPGGVYIAAGNTVYHSTDAGNTWTDIGPDNVTADPNAIYRNAGERLAIDPNNSAVLYYGTQSQGLLTSNDGGAHWARAQGLPAGVAGLGVSFVVIDPTSAKAGRSQTVYAGVFGAGLFRSLDGGASWRALASQPPTTTFFPNRAALAPDGSLLVTYSEEPNGDGSAWSNPPAGAVVRYSNGSGTMLPLGGSGQLPANQGFCAVSIDPANPAHWVIGTFAFQSGNTLWQSLDAGASWQQIATPYGTKGAPWWADYWFTTGFSAAVIDPDPSLPGRLWATDGIAVWAAAPGGNPAGATWSAVAQGIEELVIEDLHPVPGGALTVGADDVEGFSLSDDQSPPIARWFGPNGFGNGSGGDFTESSPLTVVRVGGSAYKGSGWASISHDGGMTWSAMSLAPGRRNAGSVALSSSDPNRIVWVPASRYNNTTTAYWSSDAGAHWTRSSGAPSFNYINDFYGDQQPLAADRVIADTFYLYAGYGRTPGLFLRSTDGGQTFAVMSRGVLPDSFQHALKAVPGVAGQLWMSFAAQNGQALWRSTDGGGTWNAVAGVTAAATIGFGAPVPGASAAAVYLYGTLGGIRGLYYSNDATSLPAGGLTTAHWHRITGPTQPIPSPGLHALEGDRAAFGHVEIGTAGRGVISVRLRNQP